MSEALLTKRTVSRVIGGSRLRRLLRAGWLALVQPDDSSRRRQVILFNPLDVHAALTGLLQLAAFFFRTIKYWSGFAGDF